MLVVVEIIQQMRASRTFEKIYTNYKKFLWLKKQLKYIARQIQFTQEDNMVSGKPILSNISIQED